MVSLKKILSGIKYRSNRPVERVFIRNISCDSKKVMKGDLFVAVKGHSFDGHNFIGNAARRGARVIVAEKDFKSHGDILKIMTPDTYKALPRLAGNFYDHPSSKMTMVGVTGTNGKTTITYLLESIFLAAHRKPGVIGTINYRFGGRTLEAKNTTPGPFELQSLLASMKRSGVDTVSMEVSSHSLDQGRVEGILFDYAVFTNVTRDHLDYHKTIARYFQAKAKLLGMVKKEGTAILNNDDRKIAQLKAKAASRVLTYGVHNRADIKAEGLAISQNGSLFRIVTPEYSIGMTSHLIGEHNISNILGAVTVAYSEGISKDVIKEGVESFGSVPGRLESINEGQPFKVFVDFAHTDDALVNVLSSLKGIAGGKIITVFGCGGNRDKTKRPLMGSAACAFSDEVFITSDNPRFEKPLDIIRDIEAGIKGKFRNYHILPDRRSAIRKAIESSAKGDIVLIAGKGHEKYQIIGKRIVPFDDCEVARSVLKRRVANEKK